MKLVFALGNPDPQYQRTRHNLGWLFVSAYASTHDGVFRPKQKFKADIAELTVAGQKVLLVRPQTYYNRVGESFRAICDYYEIEASDTLIVHDDLALPVGTVRTRSGGSSAGNNGLKSIAEHGGEAAQRLRIGIDSDLRQQIDDTDYVLGKPAKAEAEIYSELMAVVHQHIDDFLAGNYQTTTHRHA
jgi:peptidyl-tRNA hydrolase, PTH1 family